MSSDLSGSLHSSQDADRMDINRILTALAQIKPIVDSASYKEFIVFSPETRVRTTTVTVGSPNITDVDDQRRQSAYMLKRIPRPVTSYPLTHTTTGTLKFSLVYNGNSHKFGGRCKFTSGTSYITVNDHSWLNPTTKITIGLFLNPPAASGTKILVRKNNQYSLELGAGNVLLWKIYSGGVWQTALSYTYTPGTWINVVATYDSTVGKSLYINGSLNTSDVLTGAIATSANNLGIGHDGAGGSTVDDNTIMSWLIMISGTVDSTWVSNFNNGILDTKTYTEITTIPFLGTELPQPNATSGLCRSG